MKNSMFRRAIIRTALPVGVEGEGGGAEGDSPSGSAEEQPQEGSTPDSPGSDEPDEDQFDSTKALEKIRKLNSEASNLRKRAKEAEEKAAGADESAQRLPALEAENLRLRVGLKHGLPDAIVDRLKGDTEEDLLADAEALLKILSPQRPPSNRPTDALRGGGDPTQEPEETDLDKLGSRMFRR